MEWHIKQLKTVLPCEKFVVTGSYALYLMGLCDRPDNDLDIILIKPSATALEVAKRYQEENPAKTKPLENSSLKSIFILEQVKIDIFVQDENIETINIDGLDVTKADHIFKAKKGMGRMKDFVQLRNVAKRIFDQKEFENFLDSPKAVSSSSNKY
jgi:hypothetical protein